VSDIVIRSTSPLVLVWQPAEWMDEAACVDVDPEVWFQKDPTAAKATCAWCRVQRDCRDYALRHGIDHGVWGNLSEDERRKLKPKPAQPRPGFTRGKAPAA
jgi:WhiB family transcriptional regulator, redox-sensing transcriptional regulator